MKRLTTIIISFFAVLAVTAQTAWAQENPLLSRGFWEKVKQSEDGLAMVSAAINAGWDVNENKSRTPLHFAIATENYSSVPLLIEAGADAKLMDTWHTKYDFQPSRVSIIKGSGTPLHYAAKIGVWNTPEGWEENVISKTLQSLIDAQADINFPNINGDTPLHLAFEEGTVEAINFLIERGADQTIENAQGYTPYDLMFKRTDDHKLLSLFPEENGDKFTPKLMKVRGSANQN